MDLWLQESYDKPFPYFLLPTCLTKIAFHPHWQCCVVVEIMHTLFGELLSNLNLNIAESGGFKTSAELSIEPRGSHCFYQHCYQEWKKMIKIMKAEGDRNGKVLFC